MATKFETFRKALSEPLHAAHRGRTVKPTGDGLAAEFASAMGAARHGMEEQRRIARDIVKVPQQGRMEFCIEISDDALKLASRTERQLSGAEGRRIDRAAVVEQHRIRLPRAAD